MNHTQQLPTMKKSFFACAVGIGLASGLFLSGFLISFVMKIPVTATGDAGTWAGAFFALLAFAGTIVLATRETSRKNREAKSLARLIIPGIVMRLTLLRPGIEMAVQAMKKEPHPDRKFLRFVSRQIATYRLWTIEEVTPLTYLPKDCASQLILIKETVATVLLALRHPPNDISIHYADSIAQLEHALILIGITQAICEDEYYLDNFDL